MKIEIGLTDEEIESVNGIVYMACSKLDYFEELDEELSYDEKVEAGSWFAIFKIMNRLNYLIENQQIVLESEKAVESTEGLTALKKKIKEERSECKLYTGERMIRGD